MSASRELSPSASGVRDGLNRANIKRVRNHIAQAPAARFAMDMLFDGEGEDFDPQVTPFGPVLEDCHTVACIAGWTLALCTPQEPLWPVLTATPQARAADLLGLDPSTQRRQLFMPPSYAEPGLYTRAHAVRVLDHLLETGEVDWKSTRRARKADTTEPQASPGRTT